MDSLKVSHVGPLNAGTDPGPSCYGKGGDAPTVTDANLEPVYLNPDYFLGGEIRLDIKFTERAKKNCRSAGHTGLHGWGHSREDQ